MRKTIKRPARAKNRATGAKTRKVGTTTRKAVKKPTTTPKQAQNPFMSADLVKKNKSSYTVQTVKVGASGLKVESKNIKANTKTNKQFNEFKSKCTKRPQARTTARKTKRVR